jgi:hypothetical protein
MKIKIEIKIEKGGRYEKIIYFYRDVICGFRFSCGSRGHSGCG